MTKPQSLPAEEARKKFADLLDGTQFRSAHTEITRRGKPAGYVVPPEWYDAAVEALAESRSQRRETPPPAVAAPRQQVTQAVPEPPEDDRPALTDDEARDLVATARRRGTVDQRQRLDRTVTAAKSKGTDPDLEVIEAAFEMGLLADDDLPPAAADAKEG